MPNTNTEEYDDEYIKRREKQIECTTNHKSYHVDLNAKDVRINGRPHGGVKIFVCTKCNPKDVQSEDN